MIATLTKHVEGNRWKVYFQDGPWSGKFGDFRLVPEREYTQGQYVVCPDEVGPHDPSPEHFCGFLVVSRLLHAVAQFEDLNVTSSARARDIMRRFPVEDGLILPSDAVELEDFIRRACEAAWRDGLESAFEKAKRKDVEKK